MALDGSNGYDGIVIPGPASITYRRAKINGFDFASFEITRAPQLTAAIPAAAVMIPEDEDGQFEVILESTTDGVEWTQALPGTYGGSTAQAFLPHKGSSAKPMCQHLPSKDLILANGFICTITLAEATKLNNSFL
jgi:hypothetical protein